MSKIQSKHLIVAIVVALVVVFAIAGSSLIAGDKTVATHKADAVGTDAKVCPAGGADAEAASCADGCDKCAGCADGCANCAGCADGCDKCKDCAGSKGCEDTAAKGHGDSCCPATPK